MAGAIQLELRPVAWFDRYLGPSQLQPGSRPRLMLLHDVRAHNELRAEDRAATPWPVLPRPSDPPTAAPAGGNRLGYSLWVRAPDARAQAPADPVRELARVQQENVRLREEWTQARKMMDVQGRVSPRLRDLAGKSAPPPSTPSSPTRSRA